jgi:tRNA-(ms[2]io[6]A)-hydroxylase
MLGLKVASDAAWAPRAAAEFDALLVDHAHCELKAASNAMALAGRWTDDPSLVLALTELAREELDHFARVVAELARRRVPIPPPPVDAYAAALRRAASSDRAHRDARDPNDPLVERLLVAALIEARSAERFKLLLEALGEEHEMYAFYSELFAAEARHYRTLVDLAVRASGSCEARVRARLERLAELEAHVLGGLGEARPAIHG